LDLTAVSLVLDQEVRTLAVAAMLVETASGLILGSALAHRDAGEKLQRDTLRLALKFLDEHRADLPHSPEHAPGVALMLPEVADLDRVQSAVEPHAGDLVVGRIGGFSFGQQVVQIIGPRVGRLVMNPRRTLALDVDRFLKTRTARLVSLEEARSIWAREVDRHNADRISALRTAGIIDGTGLSNGRLATVIRAILEALFPDQRSPDV
jgi:hypothetical protein